MIRAIIAVIVGYVIWSGIWVGGGTLLFEETTEEIVDAGLLVRALVLSIACSLVAGAVAAMVAGSRRRGAVLLLAVALLATGLMVQIGAWSQMPTWYHLTFLVLLVPVTRLGGRLVPSATKQRTS